MGKQTSCSKYQPQICMFPPLSSMHFVKFCVAPAQLLPHALVLLAPLCAAAGTDDCASAGADEPPPKRPPTALLRVWPMADPTATPLGEGGG